MKERLLELLQIWGPSSREHDVTAWLAEAIRSHVDEVQVDPLGNLLATRSARGGGSGHVLLSANMDQAGGVVLYVEEDGRIRFNNVGVFPVTGAVGHTARFAGDLTGVVCYDSAEEAKDLAIGKLWVDIGATTKAEALAQVKPGNLFVLERAPVHLGPDVVASPHLKGRAGAAVLLAVAAALPPTAPTITFAFTAQGAVDSRMARPVGQRVSPDLTVVVDLTNEGKGVKMGKGPVLRLRDDGFVIYPAARSALEQAAQRANVRLQPEVLLKDGVTQAGAYMVSGPAHAVGLLALPARGVHTLHEQVNLQDLQAATQVLIELAASYGHK